MKFGQLYVPKLFLKSWPILCGEFWICIKSEKCEAENGLYLQIQEQRSVWPCSASSQMIISNTLSKKS